MTRVLRLFVLAVGVLAVEVLAVGIAPAAALELDGRLIQGGLITGRTAPDAKVTVGKRSLRVSRDGFFVFGIGRDAKSGARLVVTHADGRKEMRTLRIETRTYDVQRIDGLPRRKVSPDAQDMKRIRAEAGRIDSARYRDTPETLFRSGFIWPTKGVVSGVYGSQRILNGKPRRPHLGIDIAAPAGAPVHAAAPGIVALAEPDLFFNGGTIMIDHGHGVSSVYSHLSAVDVTVGQRVDQGARIGAVGSTGRSTGPHLDWRVQHFATRVDPALLAGPMPR